MKKVIKLILMGVLLINSIALFVGCRSEELKQGTYITDDGIGQIHLLNDGKFSINVIFISRLISGRYTINNQKLSLYDDSYELVFSIESDRIVFVGAFLDSKEEEWIMQPGKVFHLVQGLTEIEVEDIVDCSAFYFESARSSPGAPIVLNYNENEAIFECSVNQGVFYLINTDDTSNIEIAPGEGFWWIPTEEINLSNKVFVDIILKLDNRIIGYAVIEIYPSNATGLNFLARTIKASLFPKINEKFQNVTETQVITLISKIKEGK